jgi:hypothetical protein
VYKGKEEVQAMLITSLQKEKKELENKLREEFESNYEKARFEDRAMMAKRMIEKGCDVAFVAEVTGLPQETILALKVDGEKN